MKILNIAAGKQKPLLKKNREPTFTVNVDESYYSRMTPSSTETVIEQWEKEDVNERKNTECFINNDAFEFMERTRLKFNGVCIYRFLEHVPFDRVLYFIYLLSTVTGKGSVIDVIVPNYKHLAQMLSNEDAYDKDFEAHNILLTTELLNTPECPHASIWTIERAYKFFELEQRFKVIKIQPSFAFDGRDIYLRFQAKRV